MSFSKFLLYTWTRWCMNTEFINTVLKKTQMTRKKKRSWIWPRGESPIGLILAVTDSCWIFYFFWVWKSTNRRVKSLAIEKKIVIFFFSDYEIKVVQSWYTRVHTRPRNLQVELRHPLYSPKHIGRKKINKLLITWTEFALKESWEWSKETWGRCSWALKGALNSYFQELGAPRGYLKKI